VKEKQDKLGIIEMPKKEYFMKEFKMYNALPSEIRECERLEQLRRAWVS